MNCQEVQNWLEVGLMSSGIEHVPEIDSHLAQCPTCRAYAEELTALTADLTGLGEVHMTEAEAKRLHTGITRALETVEQKERSPFLARLLGWSVRPAAAVVFVVMIALTHGFDPAQTTQTATAVTSLPVVEANQADIIPLLVNGDWEQLSSLLDQTAASYITTRLHPGQADDILDSATTDEIRYLMVSASQEM